MADLAQAPASTASTTPAEPIPSQPTTPPAPESTPAPAPAEDPRMAAKFAALTRKEQAAVKALAEARAEKAEAARLREEAAKVEGKWGGLKGRPELALKTLKDELGIEYTDLTQVYLNGGQLTPEQQIQQLAQRIEQTEKQRQDEAQRAQEAAIAAQKENEAKAVEAFKGQIKEHTADAKTYPLINHFAQVDQVYALIDGHYMRTGQILEIPAASKMVEDYIRDQVTKSQELLKPAEATPAEPAPTAPSAPQAPAKQAPGTFSSSLQAKTLTPASTPVTAPTPNKPQRYARSRQEAIEQTLAKFRK